MGSMSDEEMRSIATEALRMPGWAECDGFKLSIEAVAGEKCQVHATLDLLESSEGCQVRGCDCGQDRTLIAGENAWRVCEYHANAVLAIMGHFAGSGEEGSVDVQPH